MITCCSITLNRSPSDTQRVVLDPPKKPASRLPTTLDLEGDAKTGRLFEPAEALAWSAGPTADGYGGPLEQS